MEPRQESSSLLRAPCEKPPFTLNQLKKSIPPHCFNRSLLLSFSYILHDLLFITLLFFLAITFIPKLPSPLQLITWPLYWSAQGSFLFGLWVIAHECGHQAFSNYSLLNNTVGLILHSLLLVPYFSWKYSHRRHHSNTSSLDRDEAYVPKLRSSLPWFSTHLNNPFGRLLTLTLILTIGWPMYLISNLAGRPYHRFACHFDPYSPIYNESERAQILISDAGILVVVYIMYRVAASFSLTILVRLYGAPLLVVNAWLILITYLQHTHPALPHYDSSEWDWLRGALSTVDRDYGFLNGVFHNLPDTHVVHHLFSTMPHYHAMEATKAIRPLLGDYYRLDDTPIVKALWREARECVYVKPDEGEGRRKGGGGVYWYHKEL